MRHREPVRWLGGVRALAAKPDDLSLSPRTQILEDNLTLENYPLGLHMLELVRVHAHRINVNLRNNNLTRAKDRAQLVQCLHKALGLTPQHQISQTSWEQLGVQTQARATCDTITKHQNKQLKINLCAFFLHNDTD